MSPRAVPRLARLAVALPALLLAALGLTGCTSYVDKDFLPPPLTDEKFDDPTKVVTVPLPIVASSPNEGITFGGLAAVLLHDREDKVSSMVVPQMNYNENFGVTETLFGAIYASPERKWEFNLSKSSKVNEDYEVSMRDATLMDKRLELNLWVYYFTDGSARFFGFQDRSDATETNYGDNETGFTASAGYTVMPHLQVVLGERFRHVNIREGAVKDLTDTTDVFQTSGNDAVPGLDGFDTHAQKAGLVYSTLDIPNLPTRGLYARTSVEFSAEALGSSATYQRYEAEGKAFVPMDDDARYISAARFAYIQTPNDDTPFLERASIGGENSLRGYGRNRFIGKTAMLLNLEERIRVARWDIFAVSADWEVAPFIDSGVIADSLQEIETRNIKFNPGVGLRAVVRPNIVGRVDTGFGADGPAVFAGLGYPF